MKKTKVVLMLIILLMIIGIIGYYAYSKYQEQNSIAIFNKNIETIAIAIEKDLLTEKILDDQNCYYTYNDNGNVNIKEYAGDADSIIIQNEIDGVLVENISSNAFNHAENLEIIKVEKEIAENIEKIDNFEINESLSNEEYTVFSTKREYTDEYIDYVKITEEKTQNNLEGARDEENQSIEEKEIPKKFLKTISPATTNVGAVEDNILGKYISFTPTKKTYSKNATYSGASAQSITTDTTVKWRALDSSAFYLTLISDQPVGSITFGGENGFNNFVKILHDIGSTCYSNTTYGATGRSLHMRDLYNYGSRTYNDKEGRGTYFQPEPNLPKIMSNGTDGTTTELYKYFGCISQDSYYTGTNVAQLGFFDNPYWPSDYTTYITDTTYRNIYKSGSSYWIAGRQIDHTSIGSSDNKIELVGLYIDTSYQTVSSAPFYTALSTYNSSTLKYTETITKNTPSGLAFRPVVVFPAGGVIVGDSGSGTASDPYSIKNNISNATVTLGTTSYTYDGSSKKPTVTVTKSGTTLTKGTHYTVTYDDDTTSVGTKTVTITGIGTYGGTTTKTYRITQGDIRNATATLSQTSYLYDGTEKKPKATVKYGTKTLVEGTDYELSYSNNTEAGTATTYIQGIGNYTYYISKTFTIQQNMSNLEAELRSGTYMYDGTEKKPSIFYVRDGYTYLTEDTDYTVSYKNNINAATSDSTIPPTVVLTGKGSYGGTKELTFTISQRPIGYASVTLSQYSYDYDGNAKKPTVTLKDGTTTLNTTNHYTVTFPTDITNAGSKQIDIAGKGNYTGTTSINYIINQKSISGATVTLSQSTYTYDGTTKTPTVTVKDGTKTLTKDTHYTVTYSNNTNAGTATVTIDGIGNYKDYTSKTFTIETATVSGATITLSKNTYEYDGTAKTPTATVVVNGRTLTNGTDYTASYSNNTNVGTATVTITGKGTYEGSDSKTFTITAKSMSGSSSFTIILSQNTYEYDGTAKTPGVTVKDGTKTLTQGTDYETAYSNNTNVGTGIVTVTGKGNYGGSKTANFTITAKDMSGASGFDITLSQNTYEYDGNAKTPGVTVKDGTKTLSFGTDYSVDYSNNTNVGTATVTVTGKGNYSGSKRADFTITVKDMSGLGGTAGFDITLSQNTYEYDGTAKTPGVTVKDGTRTLVLGTDYEVAYSDNIEVGTATVTVTGKGNYTGEKTKNFTIYGKSIDGFDITLSQNTYEYDGTAKEPGITVKNGGTTLTQGDDYEVAYSNNVNVGTGIVTVTGKGNYGDSKTANFTITAKDMSGTSGFEIIINPSVLEYDGTPKQPSVTVKDGIKTLTLNTDFEVVYSDNIEVGTANVTVTGIGNYSGTKTENFTIAAKDMSGTGGTLGFDITISQSSYEYDGAAKTPDVTVKDGIKILTLNTDYEVAYSDNIEVGTAKVKVTGKGNYTGSKTVNFTIYGKSADGFDIVLSQTSYEYDGTAKTPDVTVKNGNDVLINGTDYTISYEENTNAGTAKVVVTGIGNYNGTKTVNYVINPKRIDGEVGLDVFLTPSMCEYDGTAKQPIATVKDGTKILVLGTDYNIVYTDNTEVGIGKATVSGINNYNGSVITTFEIYARDISGASGFTVTLSETAYEYDGTAKEPSVTATDGNKTLILGIDYEVRYEDNTEVGTAKVIVTGKGNYSGTKIENFTIGQKNANKFNITLSETSYEYDGIAKEPSVTVKYENSVLVNGADYTVVYRNNINVGTADVIVNGTGNYFGSKTVNFQIVVTNINNLDGTNSFSVTLSQNTFTYDGDAKEPGVTVSHKGNILVNGIDYMVGYSNNINAGTAKVTITGKGNYTGAIEKTYTIGKGMPTYTVPTGLSALYDSTLGDVNLPEGFTWEDNLNTKVGNEGENTFKCTYTPKDTANYNIVTGINVKIKVYEELNIRVDGYKSKEVNGDIYLEGIRENTTIKEIKEKIATNGDIKVYDGDSEVTDDSTKAKTGMIVEITKGNEKVRYILVVTGDVNGDGKVNGADLLKLARYLIDLEKNLKTANLLAANVYKNDGRENEVNSGDLLKLARVLAEIENFDE